MKTRTLPLLIVMLLAATYTQAQWRQTAGPVGANLGRIVADDSLLVALIPQKGIYHYNGASWKHMSDSLIHPEMLVDGVMFGSAMGTGTVMRVNYRSSDYGITWQKLDVPGTITESAGKLYSIEVDTLFASTDKGLTWSVLGSIELFSSSLVSHKGELLASTGFGNLLIRSTDNGKSWEEVQCDGGTGGCVVGRLLSTPDILYSYNGGIVMKSTNSGNSWENISQGLSEWARLDWMIEENGTLWGGGFSDLYRYNGTRWENVDIAAGGIQPAVWKNRFIAASSDGLFTVPAGSTAAERLPGDLLHSSIGTMEAHNGAIFVSANTGVFRTLDQGMTWEKMLGDIWPSQFVSDGAGTIWMIADDLYSSTDNGATWRDISGNLPFDGINHIPAYNIWTDGSILMIVTGQGVFRSANGGTSWSRANAGIPAERLEYFSGSFVEIGNALYIFAYTGLYRSTNGGTMWEPVELPQGYLTYGGTSPSVVDGKVYTPLYQEAGGGMWKYSTYTFDGTTWTDITSTIPENIVFTSFARSGNFIFGGSIQDAVWKMASSASSVGTIATENRGVMMESMPNPFNDESRLRLHLPSRGNTTIALVNAVGEEIRILHDGMLDAGEHTYLLHGDDLPSGVYYIRTRTDGNATTHMLMKIAR